MGITRRARFASGRGSCASLARVGAASRTVIFVARNIPRDGLRPSTKMAASRTPGWSCPETLTSMQKRAGALVDAGSARSSCPTRAANKSDYFPHQRTTLARHYRDCSPIRYCQIFDAGMSKGAHRKPAFAVRNDRVALDRDFSISKRSRISFE